jgi:hypothetical protein
VHSHELTEVVHAHHNHPIDGLFSTLVVWHHPVERFRGVVPSAEDLPACTQAGCCATGPGRSAVHCLLG